MKIRRSASTVCCCALIFVGCISIASGQVKSADAVRIADQDWLKVFAAKNLDQSVSFVDEEGAVLAPNSPIANGREAISKLFTGFFALPDLKITWHVDRADVAHSGDLGYTSGAYEMTFNDPTGKTVSDKGKYVTVWRKQKDGSWKVLLDIFNTDLLPTGAS